MPSARPHAPGRPTVGPGVELLPEQPALDNDPFDEAPRDDDRSVEATRRRRLVVGAVLAAALVVVALAIGIAQAVQRHAHTVATDAITAAALDYLTAIAEGRGDDASALVPVEGEAPLLTDAALADAGRIQAFRVEGVELDGDAATVTVAFRSGQGPVEHELDAVREGGTWRLTTTLAEHVVLDEAVFGPLPRLRAIEIGRDRGTLLYPGRYRSEPYEHGLVSIEPMMLVIDGDPRTGITPGPGSGSWGAPWSVPTAVLDGAPERALSHAVGCQAADSCAVPAGALLVPGDSRGFALADGGAVEFDVPLQVLSGPADGPSQLWVGVRASAGAAGAIDWQCSDPVGLDNSGGVPVERDWGACA